MHVERRALRGSDVGDGAITIDVYACVRGTGAAFSHSIIRNVVWILHV